MYDPGSERYTLETQREINAVYFGAPRDADGLLPPVLADLLDTEDVWAGTPINGNTLDLAKSHNLNSLALDVPKKFPIASENAEIIRESVSATLAISGLRGLLLSVNGTKRAARRILGYTESLQSRH